MWDGCSHPTREEAVSAAQNYRDNNFEIYLAEQAGEFFVYSRRVVKEIVATTQ